MKCKSCPPVHVRLLRETRLHPPRLEARLAEKPNGGTMSQTWIDYCSAAHEVACWDEEDVAFALGALLGDGWDTGPAIEMVTSAVKLAWTANEFVDWYAQVKVALQRGETSGTVVLPLSGAVSWDLAVVS